VSDDTGYVTDFEPVKVNAQIMAPGSGLVHLDSGRRTPDWRAGCYHEMLTVTLCGRSIRARTPRRDTEQTACARCEAKRVGPVALATMQDVRA
jgi:hypothetical protein